MFLCLLVHIYVFFVLMRRRPPRSTRTDTLCPYTTLFRSPGLRRSIGLPCYAPSARIDACFSLTIVHKQASSTRWSTANGSAAASSRRSEEHTSELQSLMRISYAVFCLKKKKKKSITKQKENHIISISTSPTYTIQTK